MKTQNTEKKNTQNTVTKKNTAEKKEKNIMTTKKAEAQKNTEKKAETVKRTIDDVKKVLDRLTFEHVLIDVKPGGVGIKVKNTRICAVYLTRTADYRIKTNKLSAVDNIINEYATSLEAKLTADKRDYNITSVDIDDDMLITFITELSETDSKEKAETAQKKAEEKKAKAEAQQKAKAEKKAQKEAEKQKKEAQKKAETIKKQTAQKKVKKQTAKAVESTEAEKVEAVEKKVEAVEK